MRLHHQHTHADEGAFVQTATAFINKNWELYGRKIHLDYVTGNCAYAPPDVACLRAEADSFTAGLLS